MASLTPSLELSSDILENIRARINGGGAGMSGTIDIYTGAKPTRPNVAVTTQVKLGTVTCAEDCGSVSIIDGVPTLTFSATVADSAADATGVAAWGRIKDGSTTPTPVLDFDISTTGGSGFGQMNTTSVVIGGPISAPSIVITA